jgi:Na+-translocating ferredoxin:NAD+ oxidoreductase RnfC subunit
MISDDSRSRASLLQRIEEHGVVGAGGAGFPTHVKLASRAECIILNAAECEPLLHKDKELLRHYGAEVMAGLSAAAELVGASQVVVGVKGKYQDVIEELTPKLPAGARIVRLSDSYPSGDEMILVYDVTGRIVPPGGIPIHVGCVVMNVETAYNIACDAPVTQTFLTVAGAVAEPCTLRVPVGITFAEALELAGGSTVAEPHLLAGGVMMGRPVGLDEPITKTCGGVIVLGRDHVLVRRYQQNWQQIARIGASACDQCSFCTELCPRYLLGHPIEPHKAMRSLGFVENREPTVIGTQFCCECNLCTMIACPEDLDPKNVCARNKRQLAAEGRRVKVEPHPYRAELHLGNRRVPISRLILKLGLRGFRNEGPLRHPSIRPRRVTLPLLQHIGVPATPTVSSGTRVNQGDLVARPANGALGARIHASIAGVCQVAEDCIVIVAD